MPRVSVIIPNYNKGPFLAQRIQSILDQTYQDFEIIYLDDASTDNSSEIFAQFAHNHKISKVIINDVNSGNPFKQWNGGIREARGEYIWIAEADDYADKIFLERSVEILENNLSVGLVYCQSWKIDEKNNIISSFLQQTNELNPERWKRDFVNNGTSECSKYLVYKNTIPNASAVLFRRSLYLKADGADETMKLCGDWLLWSRILMISDIAFIATPMNYFRYHKETVSRKIIDTDTYINESLCIIYAIIKSVNNASQECMIKVSYEMLRKWANNLKYGRGIYRILSQAQRSFYRRITRLNPSIKFKITIYIKMLDALIFFITSSIRLRTRLKKMQAFLRNKCIV